MLLNLAAASLICGCSRRPAEPQRPDPVKEAWYDEHVRQLAALNLEAEKLLRSGKSQAAGSKIEAGQPLSNRLLSVPRPTLAAMQGASDLDELYGRKLLASRHYGWARLSFQKNAARWKAWQPQTEETIRRRKSAEAFIAECDRWIAKQH